MKIIIEMRPERPSNPSIKLKALVKAAITIAEKVMQHLVQKFVFQTASCDADKFQLHKYSRLRHVWKCALAVQRSPN